MDVTFISSIIFSSMSWQQFREMSWQQFREICQWDLYAQLVPAHMQVMRYLQ